MKKSYKENFIFCAVLVLKEVQLNDKGNERVDNYQYSFEEKTTDRLMLNTKKRWLKIHTALQNIELIIFQNEVEEPNQEAQWQGAKSLTNNFLKSFSIFTFTKNLKLEQHKVLRYTERSLLTFSWHICLSSLSSR